MKGRKEQRYTSSLVVRQVAAKCLATAIRCLFHPSVIARKIEEKEEKILGLPQWNKVLYTPAEVGACTPIYTKTQPNTCLMKHAF